MFSKDTYIKRRAALVDGVNTGLLLFMGNEYVGMNYADNTYHFRQDSNFLYFFGLDQESLCGLIDIDEGKTIMFGDELSLDYVVWMGAQKTIKEKAAEVGVENTRAREELHVVIQKALTVNRPIHILPPYRAENKIFLSKLLDTTLEGLGHFVSEELIQRVVQLRSIKEPVEITEMAAALATTKKMHMAAMIHARPGIKEYDLTGRVQGEALAGGGNLAYPIILTVNGQTLHNHYHGNTLASGQLILGDFGAETAMHYAGDITRTFPVDKTFTARQKSIYEIVLKAEKEVIKALKAGTKYLDMHLLAARITLEGLKSLDLVRGNVDDALAAGAYGLFFPHGVGHMIGLDVHDMEDLGEQYVGYRPGLERSKIFGLRSLRLAKELEVDNVITVEPGIYFIPELIAQWSAEGKHKAFLNYEKIKSFIGLGGIRIEDNCQILEDNCQILGPYIPKEIEEIEEIRSIA